MLQCTHLNGATCCATLDSTLSRWGLKTADELRGLCICHTGLCASVVVRPPRWLSLSLVVCHAASYVQRAAAPSGQARRPATRPAIATPSCMARGRGGLWAWAGRAYKAACAVPQCQGGQQRALFACLLPLLLERRSGQCARACATTRAPLAQPRPQVALCAVVCVWVLLPVPCQGGCWR